MGSKSQSALLLLAALVYVAADLSVQFGQNVPLGVVERVEALIKQVFQ